MHLKLVIHLVKFQEYFAKQIIVLELNEFKSVLIIKFIIFIVYPWKKKTSPPMLSPKQTVVETCTRYHFCRNGIYFYCVKKNLLKEWSLYQNMQQLKTLKYEYLILAQDIKFAQQNYFKYKFYFIFFVKFTIYSHANF